jgi:pimeloyl-ACP methyl ester carboxylesterase
LAYDFTVAVDGAELKRPVNYALVRIQAPAGVSVQEDARPYIIIDPRAGHGSGIGGFKSESEVGVALDAGHPVYSCIFKTHPEPGQTIADVTRAEAGFVREVSRRHPDSAKPVVIGNCQGGWAAMLLAATNPDLIGPLLLNGAPLSYWSGTRGKHPMRYYGGIYGGVAPIMLMADG